MADVVLGPVGSAVLVDLDVCVKTGRVTDQRVTLRGHTTPAWVTLLLFVSVIGFLIASSNTSRRYLVRLPFTHAVHDRWQSNRRIGWLVALAGVGALVAAVSIGAGHTGLLVGIGIALLVGSVGISTSNAMRNHVGIYATRDGDLALTRAHPAFAEAARAATIEPLPSH